MPDTRVVPWRTLVACRCRFARSHVVELALKAAHDRGIDFRVIVADSRPLLEGACGICVVPLWGMASLWAWNRCGHGIVVGHGIAVGHGIVVGCGTLTTPVVACCRFLHQARGFCVAWSATASSAHTSGSML